MGDLVERLRNADTNSQQRVLGSRMTILQWRLSAWACFAAQQSSLWVIDAMPLAMVFFAGFLFCLAVADILRAIAGDTP
jgi:hypothetical protein